ncbi:MAG: hypothetical protein IJK89_01035 [Clostridia bacterium]|nr:hypothetical protein [Clostridia bacterium]
MSKAKKLLSVVFAVLFVLPMGLLPAFAANDVTPIVYVYGYRGIYVHNEDGSYYTPIDEYAPPETTDGDIVSAAISELLPLFAKALVTDNYDEYCDRALELLSPIYAEIKPNPDGTVPANTDCGWNWSYDRINANPGPRTIYEYNWDTRLSPMDVADDLNDYINAIMEKTGSSQIVLAARCAGTEVAAAYLWKYQKPVGYANIKKYIFTASTLEGYDYFDLIGSGNVTVPDEALYRYVRQKEILENNIGDEKLYTFVSAMFDYLESSYGLKLAMGMVDHIYAKIKDRFIARFLKEFYGISLGQVGSINEHYEDYKNYVFQEKGDKEKYAAIIAKADDYHYNVQAHFKEMLQEMDAADTPVYAIGGYGEQQYPIGDCANYVGDEYVNVGKQTLGATVSKVTETLPDDYIAGREAAGYGKYISPDRQVDASTCLFPDHTRIVKNLRHDFNNSDVFDLVTAIALTENATVTTLEGYPQFLNAKEDHSAMEPMQAVNANDIDWDALAPSLSAPANALAKIAAFFARIILWFRSVFSRIGEAFTGK